jgi:hypothetical protein
MWVRGWKGVKMGLADGVREMLRSPISFSRAFEVAAQASSGGGDSTKRTCTPRQNTHKGIQVTATAHTRTNRRTYTHKGIQTITHNTYPWRRSARRSRRSWPTTPRASGPVFGWFGGTGIEWIVKCGEINGRVPIPNYIRDQKITKHARLKRFTSSPDPKGKETHTRYAAPTHPHPSPPARRHARTWSLYSSLNLRKSALSMELIQLYTYSCCSDSSGSGCPGRCSFGSLAIACPTTINCSFARVCSV